MRILFANGMAILTVLCVVAGVAGLGAVNPDVALPLNALAVLLALCWAGRLFFAGSVSWKKSPMHTAVALFCVYAIVRYFTSAVEYDARLELFRIILFALVYFAVTSNLYQPRDREILVWTLMFLVVAEAAYGLWQVGTKAEKILWWVRPEGYRDRAGGTFVCPNSLAGFLELVLGLVIARTALLRVRSGSLERRTLHKVFVIYVAFMAIAGIVATFSRAGWLSTVIGLIVFLIGLIVFLFRGGWRLRLSWPPIAVVIVTLSVMVVIAFKWEPVRRYISRSLAGEQGAKAIALRDVSLGGRTKMWEATARMIQDHPMFGTGPGTWQWIHQQYKSPTIFSHPEDAHNDFLQATSDYGLIGFVLVAAALACYFRHAWLMSSHDLPSEQRAFAVGGMISAVMILVHSWFDFNMHIPGNALLFVVIMAFTVAMDDPANRFPRVEMKKPLRIVLGSALLLLCFAGVWCVGRATMAVRLTNTGNDHKRFLQYDEALESYEKAISWDEKYPEPHAKIADIYRTKAQWLLDPARAEERKALAREAADEYGHALALNPYLSEVWVRLGRAQELASDNNAALKSYRRSVELDPQNAFSWQMLGRFYRDIGDTNNAAAAFKKSFDLASLPENVGAQINYGELLPALK